jgi:hypothetical protein
LLTDRSRLHLNIIIDFVIFMLIGAAFPSSIGETFLLVPAIVNVGLLLSIQDFPWRISWRTGQAVTDEERQDPGFPHVANNGPAQEPPLFRPSPAFSEPVENRTGH